MLISTHIIFDFFKLFHFFEVNIAVPTGISKILPEKSFGIFDNNLSEISLSFTPFQNILLYILLKKLSCVKINLK